MKKRFYKLCAAGLFSLLICTMFPSFILAESGLQDAVEFYDELDDAAWLEEEKTPQIRDPWEKYNRWMFRVNDKIFTYALEPVSKGYDFVVPKKFQRNINNFFSNIRYPIRFFNCLFQGKFKGAATETGRFLVNTVTGFAGFMDPAEEHFDWYLQDEDFGQTLGRYGAGTGPYFVWPIMGPSSVRDSIGFVVDAALNPATWFYVFDVVKPDEILRAATTVKTINSFSYNIRDTYRDILDSALDPYTAIQDAYAQSRKKKVEE